VIKTRNVMSNASTSDGDAQTLPSQAFDLFPKLPSELRQLIWAAHLDAPTPRVIRCQLQYPRRRPTADKPGEYETQLGDDVFLDPAFTRGLVKGTFASRTLSATYAEARAAVLRRYPDVLPFRLFGRNFLEKHDGRIDEVDFEAAGYPAKILRFNGDIDIFIFGPVCHEQGAMADILKLRGALPTSHPFARIRHIAIQDTALCRTDRSFLPINGDHVAQDYGCSHGQQAWCDVQQCPDACEREGLPRLLACFPRLSSFYIAQIPHIFALRPGSEPSADPIPSSTVCACRQSSDKATKHDSSDITPIKHHWPTARVLDLPGYCVIYDERDGCQIPTPKSVQKVRQRWRRHFPYYDALGHLDIKFITWLEDGRVLGEKYDGPLNWHPWAARTWARRQGWSSQRQTQR
jgi:hypothetical protein